jgi:hypothetical protein
MQLVRVTRETMPAYYLDCVAEFWGSRSVRYSTFSASTEQLRATAAALRVATPQCKSLVGEICVIMLSHSLQSNAWPRAVKVHSFELTINELQFHALITKRGQSLARCRIRLVGRPLKASQYNS